MNGLKAAILVFLGLCPAMPVTAESNKTPIAAPSAAPLVSPSLVRDAGWKLDWQINLPLKENETIDQVSKFGSYLYVRTSTNLLFCLDPQTGRTRSFLQLGPSGLPVSSPVLYDEDAWFIIGNEVLVFDPATGVVTFRKRFPQIGNNEGGLARNTTHLFVAGSDRRLHAFNVDGYWQEFMASADNDSIIVSIVATDDIVAFATEAGNVVGMSAAGPQKMWQFDATGGIRGRLRLDDIAIYFGSEDSKLYKLDLKTGALLWPSAFHSGGPIRDGVTLGKQMVYVYNDLNGMYGVNKETGKAVWQIPSGRTLLCETDTKAFIFADAGLVKVMDNQKGQELYSMNFTEVTRMAVNPAGSVMFVGDARGRLASITVK
ncbi:MAG: PQQ-like beta-propeller repeat protein [Planctomycetaceae bacterium]|nr:PQQ-like beta-propeller repeat protein [Planctomycetaceae bacterium]